MKVCVSLLCVYLRDRNDAKCVSGKMGPEIAGSMQQVKDR